MKPYIQTFTAVAGGTACNAHCPFCISKQTPNCGVPVKPPEINVRNLGIGMDIAKGCGAFTALISSKGEATLFPENLTDFIREATECYSLVELQTNGIRLMEEEFCDAMYDTCHGKVKCGDSYL